MDKNNNSNNNRNTNILSMVEASIISVVAVVLILVIKQIPILNYMLFVVPVVFSLVWVRRGLKYGILSVVVAFLIALILGFVMESIFILIYCGGVSSIMSEFVIRNKRTSIVIFAGSMGAFISLFVMLYFMQFIMGINFNEMVSQSLDETKQVFEIMDSEIFTRVNVDEQLEMMEYSLRQFLPSIMFFCSFIVSALNYVCMRWAFRRILNKNIRRDYLRDFSLPSNLMYGIAFMMIGAWLFKLIGGDPSGAVGNNILSLSFFALFIQGLAVLAFVVHRNKWSRGIKVVLIIFCILFMNLLQIGFVLAGCLDLVFNLRKKIASNDQDGNNRR